MADLIAKTPCAGLGLPLTIGAVTLSEIDGKVLTLIAPYRDAEGQISDTLKQHHGMALPTAGRSTTKSGARALWFGQGKTLLMGPAPATDLAKGAAITDQSDAWAIVQLSGDAAEDVLARWVPIDLRAASFKRGHTARTLVGHMMASVTRTGANSFQIMVFRSMAQTLVHELSTAMQNVATRGQG